MDKSKKQNQEDKWVQEFFLIFLTFNLISNSFKFVWQKVNILIQTHKTLF